MAPRRKWTGKTRDLGKLPDAQVSQSTGFSISAIKKYRKAHGIPGCPSRRRDPALRRLVVRQLGRIVPVPWRKLFPLVREAYGRVAEPTLRKVLRDLIAEDVVRFIRPDGEGGETWGYIRGKQAHFFDEEIEDDQSSE